MKRLLAACLALMITNPCTAQSKASAVDSLVAAERAFAKRSHDTNIREAFLAYFADDGVVFNPGPTNAKNLYSKKPIPPNPPPVTLDWEPKYAEVSQDGNLGFTTGPYSLTDNAKKEIAFGGNFFSVWKKQLDGTWKVVLDFGIQKPPCICHLPVKVQSNKPHFKAHPPMNAGSDRTSLMQLDQDLTADSYPESFTSQSFILRNGMDSAMGRLKYGKTQFPKRLDIKWHPINAGLATSGDLAYVYGSYQEQKGQQGYYARVWKRNHRGRWQIMLDVASELPQEEEKK